MEISEHYISHYGEQPFIEILVAKLVFHNAKDLSDTEIERCFKDCVLSNKLTTACKELRGRIDWKKVINGQIDYLSECDNLITPIQRAHQQKQLVLDL